MNAMTKSELIERVQQAEGVPELTKKNTAAIVDAVFDSIKAAMIEPRALGDKKFSYPGFGSFRAKKREARKGYNPATREAIMIDAYVTVGFQIAPSFKAQIPVD